MAQVRVGEGWRDVESHGRNTAGSPRWLQQGARADTDRHHGERAVPSPEHFRSLHPGIDDSQFFNFVQILRYPGESQSVYGLRTVGLGGATTSCQSLEELARI